MSKRRILLTERRLPGAQLSLTMNDLTRGERLQIMLTPEELSALDDWRFQKRMPSRAAAVRELLKRGLAAEGFATAANGQHSRDFGVFSSGQSGEPAHDGAPIPAPNGHDEKPES